ncbi:phosphoribosyltransferase [Candidatus Bathyarchaeota archaeon]|jgi:hypoxanthine phosphoribosyltransferase|nr:phosphoribosyltransferase [Candidatus Bathyarchaeota archaeon]
MEETPNLLVPSWDVVYQLLIQLAEAITAASYEPNLIIAVSRGGFIPGRILADLLGCAVMRTIGVSFYEDIGRRGRMPTVTQPLSGPINDDALALVVDDIADTGETLALVQHELEPLVRGLKTATIYRKPCSSFIPDFSGQETDAWVIFPWEVCESVKRIGKRLLQSGRTFPQAQEYLLQAGIPRGHVQKFMEDLLEGGR